MDKKEGSRPNSVAPYIKCRERTWAIFSKIAKRRIHSVKSQAFLLARPLAPFDNAFGLTVPKAKPSYLSKPGWPKMSDGRSREVARQAPTRTVAGELSSPRLQRAARARPADLAEQEGPSSLSRANQLAFYGKCLSLANEKTFAAFLRTLFREDWVVYAKPPFGGPEHVLHYLARYTHRVAISNHHILAVNDSYVTTRWKGYAHYAHHNRQRPMTLTCEEFLRRFFVQVAVLEVSEPTLPALRSYWRATL